MIKIEENTNLVINKDRHVVKTTNEYNVLPYEVIIQDLQSVGFQVIEYTEQNYYNRSIRKGRNGKGLFSVDLVSPIHPLIGITLSSANDNQMSLYIHATIKGIPVKELSKIRHLASESLDLDIKKLLNDLEGLRDQFALFADTEINQNKVIESFQALNSYRAEVITNSAEFIPVQSANLWELFENLADSMINGKGIAHNVKFTKKITQIRKKFLIGQRILQVLAD
jgi:hypothetical protein